MHSVSQNNISIRKDVTPLELVTCRETTPNRVNHVTPPNESTIHNLQSIQLKPTSDSRSNVASKLRNACSAEKIQIKAEQLYKRSVPTSNPSKQTFLSSRVSVSKEQFEQKSLAGVASLIQSNSFRSMNVTSLNKTPNSSFRKNAVYPSALNECNSFNSF